MVSWYGLFVIFKSIKFQTQIHIYHEKVLPQVLYLAILMDATNIGHIFLREFKKGN